METVCGAMFTHIYVLQYAIRSIDLSLIVSHSPYCIAVSLRHRQSGGPRRRTDGRGPTCRPS